MNLDDVKNYLEENKEQTEVKEYLNGLKTVSTDDVKGFLDTKEGQRFIQPDLDRYFTKGLESWKEKNLEKIVDEEIAKRNPEQSDEQKRISALEKELEKRDAETKHEKIKSFGLSKAQELGVPSDLVERFLGSSDEETEENLSNLKSLFDDHIQKGVETRFKENGREVHRQNDNTGSVSAQSIEDMAKEINIRNQQ